MATPAEDPLDALICAKIAAHSDLSVGTGTGSEINAYGELDAGPRGTLRRREDYEHEDGSATPQYTSSPDIGTGDDLSVDRFFSGLAVYTLEMGREYKKRKGLSQESDNDADKYLKTPDLIERNFMSYVALLQTRDGIRALVEDKKAQYKVPDTLKTAAQEYAAVAIRSPSISGYRSSELPALIYDVMRQLNVSDLPAPHDLGRRELVLGVIGKALTNGRHTLKNEIVKGLEDKKDIATLTKACIGSSKAKASAALYIRIAFVRREWKRFLAAKSTRNAGEDAFWVEVDNQLKEMRTKYDTAHKLQIAHEVIYEQDKNKYGEPAVSSDFTMLKDLDDWLVALNQGVARVSSK